VPILEKPSHSTSWRVGVTEATAYLGKSGGQNVAIVVAKDGPHAGKVIASFIPDANQLKLMLGR
jgi:hypothetical protein